MRMLLAALILVVVVVPTAADINGKARVDGGDLMGASRIGSQSAGQLFFRPRLPGFLPNPIFLANALRWAA